MNTTLIFSPWGRIISAKTICRGLHYVTTHIHGGYILSNALAKKILPEKAIKLGSPYNNNNYICYEYSEDWLILYYEILTINTNNKHANRTKESFLKYLKEENQLYSIEYVRDMISKTYRDYFNDI